jgi:phage terminase large subunit-like protein
MTSGERAEYFFNRLKHFKGRWSGKKFLLMDWQKSLIHDVFGTLDENGKRRYRTVYCEVPRKNGKSETAAGIALYLTCYDDEPAAEVYGAAHDRDQAGLVFSAAAGMVRKSGALSNKLRIVDSTKRILHEASNSFYRAIPADAAGAFGFNASGVVFDEFHTQRNRELYDALITSTGAREQPLTFIITTAGFDRESICWEVHDYARKVESGVIDDPTFYPVIFAADDDDDWTDPEVWKKANPSLGTTITEEFLDRECKKALEVPAYQNTFRRLYLNQWCVDPETLITMADGSRKRADALLAGDIVLSFDEATRSLARATVKCVADNGVKPTIKIKTARGRSITVTPNHMFWCREGRADAPKYGWVEAQSIKEGGRVAVALGASLPRGSRRMSADVAKFLGVMVGDGTCSGTDIRLTSVSAGVIDYCSHFAQRHECVLKKVDEYHWDFRHHVQSRGMRPVKRLLKKYGVHNTNCYNKTVPEAVFRGGRNVWASFLSGYTDTDGCIAERSVIWVSACRELLDGCQHLLSMLGVQSALKERDNCGYTQYRLEVHEADGLGILSRVLDLSDKEKARKLEALGNLPRRTGLAASDRSCFDRVVSVEDAGERPTVGIEIEETHTHITNGLITHNTSQESRWLDMGSWDASAGMVVEADLVNRPCYAGLDLAATTDITALSLVFPFDDRYETLLHFWIPSEKLLERERRDKVPYRTWIKQGYMTATPGNVCDYDFIRHHLGQLAKKYDIKEVAYDPWNASQFSVQLMEDGFQLVEVRQGYKTMSPACKEMERLVLEKKLIHGGNPVLRWMADNVMVVLDPAGNLKMDKSKSTNRIDGMVALAMALFRASLREKEKVSVYEERGPLII